MPARATAPGMLIEDTRSDAVLYGPLKSRSLSSTRHPLLNVWINHASTQTWTQVLVVQAVVNNINPSPPKKGGMPPVPIAIHIRRCQKEEGGSCGCFSQPHSLVVEADMTINTTLYRHHCRQHPLSTPSKRSCDPLSVVDVRVGVARAQLPDVCAHAPSGDLLCDGQAARHVYLV